MEGRPRQICMSGQTVASFFVAFHKNKIIIIKKRRRKSHMILSYNTDSGNNNNVEQDRGD